MIRVLSVDSEHDYGAMDFEQSEVAVEEAYGLAEENDGVYIDSDEIEFVAHTFGDVDETFINWVSNTYMDEDTKKHKNFYVLGDE